jgi:hypothetical protein
MYWRNQESDSSRGTDGNTKDGRNQRKPSESTFSDTIQIRSNLITDLNFNFNFKPIMKQKKIPTIEIKLSLYVLHT